MSDTATAAKLDAFERDFVAALQGDAPHGVAAALAAQPGFAIYRNTVRRGAIDALVANHPTVRQLAGDEWIEGAAALFALEALPSDGSLAGYGLGFADFLDRFPPAAELPYLADVARLDRAWTEAHLAADAPALGAAELASLPPERLLEAVLVPHPSARWLRFESQPAFTIWRRHREGTSLDDELEWSGECALVVRPALTVQWHALSLGAFAFLAACAEGRSFADAAQAAQAAQAALVAEGAESAEGVVAAWLPGLVAAGAFTRIASPEHRP